MKTSQSVFILYDKAHLVWGFPLPHMFSYMVKGLHGKSLLVNQPGAGRAVQQGSTRGQQRAGLHGAGSAQVTDLRSRQTHEAAEAWRPSQALSLGTEDLGRMSCVTKLKTLEAQT